MLDPRWTRLAQTLVTHSLRLCPGEKVLVEAFDAPPDFTAELVRSVAEAGGLPMATTYQQGVLRALYRHATEDQMRAIGAVKRAEMESADCYVGVRGSHNIAELSDVPPDRMALYERHWWQHVHTEVRLPKTRWVVLRWPNPSMAQAAGMSTEAFEDFYFRVCAEVDYGRMAERALPLKELMDRTDRVEITGPGTELRFSKLGVATVPCSGQRNIPDGEVFTCPVRDSVEGVVTFNAETLYRGTVFSGVRLVFERGRIVEATAGAQTAALNHILDSDEGARYIGEWSLGINPYITAPMKDILFDEKIAGSFHLTPGNAYGSADNGNRSQVHWDMVMVQTPAFGGGRIQFDGVTVREDGRFVLPELEGLNPESLGA